MTHVCMKTLVAKSNHLKRLRNGYQWLFSNEVVSPLRQFTPGEIVRITDEHDHFAALAYVNPRSLICARVLTLEDENIDDDFFTKRIRAAMTFRKKHLPDTHCCRCVFGESDFLPGLVVDKYGDVLVVQSTTAGMDALWPHVERALVDVWKSSTVVLRNDSPIRKLEGIALNTTVIRGKLNGPQEVTIAGLTYAVDFEHGQKTGFFLDQRFNHTRLAPFVNGKRVLDCFSHLGGWGLQAARHGAAAVLGLDLSAQANDMANANASRNGLSACHFRTADVFDELKSMNDRGETYDVIILDPPAFAKSRSEVPDAIRGYREINRRAAKALKEDGILITCSCSHLIEPETFRNTVLQAIQASGKSARVLDRLAQPVDHPILLGMRETEYLKGFILEVFNN